MNIEMDEVQLPANYSGCCSSNSFAASELHNLGVFNAHMSHSLVCTPPYLPSDVPGTGYLQDALFEFSSRRRRLSLFSDDQTNHDLANFPIESCWRENCYLDSFECLSQEIHCISGKSKDNSSSSESGKNSSGERERVMREKMQGAEEAISTFQDSSSSLHTKYSLHLLSNPAAHGGGSEKKRKVITRVLYPFAVIKPGGIEEGDMSLNDINERILMPPTRPVRHPVGDFASRPFLFSDGRGLSGKTVVALTRIQTLGRGTITIIRTKG